MEFISHSRGDGSFGRKFGRRVTRICLRADRDLGAAKRSSVKGIARGLGVTARVHSPTFTLVNEYGGGRLKLFHLDLYRLETPAQILSAGIEGFCRRDGVAVIEWAERIANEDLE